MNYKRLLSAIMVFAMIACLVPALSVFAQDTKLSVGKSYTVEYDSKIDNAYPARAYKQESALTDGRLASTASYSDSAFLKLYRGTKVIVTIDLEKVCAITSVEVRTLQNKGAGIECPRYVYVAVSEDGETFGTVGSTIDEESVTLAGNRNITQKVVLDQAYKARYVRVTFSSDVYLYCDEVTVYGSETVGSATSAKADEPVNDAGFASPIDGINNVVLMYTSGNYSESTLRPYLAYVGTDGTATDLMFDSMLFLPSGASGFDFDTQKGWDDFVANLFSVGKKCNLDALNSLVGKMREQLSLDADYRYPVFLSVPYLDIGSTAIYGTVPNKMENRLKVLHAYIDLLISTFESAGFDNLEFKGVYWHHELIPYTNSTTEDDLIKQFNEYVHTKGLKSIWIPYYCAPGFETAVELGFDCATLQSGYAFPRSGDSLNEIGAVQPGAVEDSAAQAKKYGLGMEFEFNINAGDAAARFYKYLHTGYVSGCMENGMMMLYQTVTDIYQCAMSTSNSEERAVYDLLYQYINKTFTSNAPVVESNGALKVLLTGKRTSGTVSVVDEDSLKNDLMIYEQSATEGLTYVLEGDGFYLVNTKDTAPGRYSITFRVTDGYNLSEQATLDFLVVDGETAEYSVTLESDLTAYVRDDASAESLVFTKDTVLTVIAINDDWFYATAKIEGKTIGGFVGASSMPEIPGFKADTDDDSDANSEASSSSEAVAEENTDGDSTLIIIIASSAAVLLAVIVILVFVLRKKKKA